MIGNQPVTTIGGILPDYYLPVTIPRIFLGSAAPAVTPERAGDIFIDQTAGNIYIAKNTTANTDWIQIN